MKQTIDVGKTPLRYEEKMAFQELSALLGCIGNLNKKLEKRLRSVPGGWRDARMMEAVASSLVTRLTDTIPIEKAMALVREIKHTQVYIRTTPDYGAKQNDDVTYVNEQALDRLVQRVMSFECHMCDRNRAEAKACPVRRDIEAMYHFALPVKDGETCPLMGMSLVREEE